MVIQAPGNAATYKAPPNRLIALRKASVPPAPGGLPQPYTPQQIGSTAQGELSPILAAVTAAINKQAQGASTAIGGYAGSLANSLKAVDYGAPYVGAEGKQAAVDASLAQALSGGGTALAGDLQSRLAQIGEPGVVNDAAGGIAARGVAAGNTELARGGAALSNLISNEASARSYGEKLPGLAQLSGLRDISATRQSAQNQIGTQTGNIESQLPGILNSLRSESDSRANNLQAASDRKASQASADTKTKLSVILSTGIDPKTGLLTPAAQKAAAKLGFPGLVGTGKAPAAPKASPQLSAGNGFLTDTSGAPILNAQGNQQPYKPYVKPAAPKATKATKAGVFSASASNTLKYRADGNGQPIGGKITPLPGYGFDKSGNIVKVTSGGGTSKVHGFTPVQVAKFNGNATLVAQNAHDGNTASGVKPMTYQAAVLAMEERGIPAWVYIPALNKVYTTPDSGNPYISGPVAPKR